MASTDKQSTVAKEVTFYLSDQDNNLSQPMPKPSPRMSRSSIEIKLKDVLEESDNEAVSTELPTFDFERSKQGANVPIVAGQTENETKARKLNKTEESRLETLRSHFEKQQTIFEKQYKQVQHRFRIRSARVLPNSFLNETKQKGSMLRNERPKSLPAHLPSMDIQHKQVRNKQNQNGGHSECETGKPCVTCDRIQNIIKQYEKEMKTNFDVDNNHHTVCLFSDTQMKNFINLVETKYCNDLPGVAEMLHNSKTNKVPNSNRSDSSSAGKSEGINDRIKAFCKSQEEFNEKHPVSRSVKAFIDKERIAQATLATKTASMKYP